MRPRFRKRHGGETGDIDASGVEEATTGPSFDDLLAERLAETETETETADVAQLVESAEPPEAVETTEFVEPPESIEPTEPAAAPGTVEAPGTIENEVPEPPRQVTAMSPTGAARAGDDAPRGAPPGSFWDHYDRAAAEAELAAIPPASVIAVVGPIEAAAPVVAGCREQHWMRSACDVFVLTKRRNLPELPSWTIVDQPSDLVAVLDDGRSDFPVLVIDVPADLPAFVRPLVSRLREGGVGLVHYVLDGNPDDEDLATWHGEIGQPAVLDLASPIDPSRVLELFDRGEPLVSVAGRPLTTELLLAFRADGVAVGAATLPVHPAATAT